MSLMLASFPWLCWVRVSVAFIAVAVASAAANPSDNPQTLGADLTKARTLAISNFAHIAAETGFADQIVARLDSDQTDVTLTNPNDAAALEPLLLRVGLDVSLVDQLATNSASPSGQEPSSAALRLVRSSADQTFQPLAVYLPTSYASQKIAPLVLMLHGPQQTETELISEPIVRKLADARGAIVAVPWARGDAPMNSATLADVDDALAFLQVNYRIDTHRMYLAGFSLGSLDVFTLAPHDPQRWAAVLSIGGTLTNSDKDAFARAMRSKPVFLVIGSDDRLVNVQYVREAEQYLSANGIDCHYYEQPGGVHSLASVTRALTNAWDDMFSAMHLGEEQIESPSPSPVAIPSQRV
jgi:poly(3-hydroxybutyrate) depolymerase